MKVKLQDGRIKDVPVTEVTAENYIVPENVKEKRMYHVLLEVKKFDANTGARLSRPRVQKFGKKYFESVGQHELQKQGYTITILHNPNDFIASEKEAQAKIAKQKAEEAEAKHQAEIKKAVEEALAEQAKTHKAEIDKAVKEALNEQTQTAGAKRGRKAKAEQEAENE